MKHLMCNTPLRRAAGRLLLIAGTLAAGAAAAATLRVDSQRCSLQDAVEAADRDIAVGGCAAGSGDDTIRITPGSDIVIDAGRVPAAEGDIGRSALRVSQGRLTVIGNGSTIRRLPDDPLFRAFALSGSAEVTLDGITLSGFVTEHGGAAIRVDDDARLTLRRSSLRNNLSFPSGSGGGLLLSSRGAQRIDTASISENVGNDSGGGIALRGFGEPSLGDVTIVNSTLGGNQANVAGAAAIHADVPLRLTIAATTITGNLGFGSTVAGAIAMRGGRLRLQQSVIAGNANPGSVEVRLDRTRTQSSQNVLGRAEPGAPCVVSFIGLTPAPDDQLADCTGPAPLPLSAILDPVLRDNANGVPTHGLVPGSPAIDRIAAADCARSTDARGVARPVDGNRDGLAACDAGAHEFNEPLARFNPARVDFGATAVDTARVVPVTLSNIGVGTLQIDEIGLRSPCCAEAFSIVANRCPAALAAGDACVVELQFRPVTAGTASGRLLLRSNDPRGLRGVALSGSQAAAGTSGHARPTR